MDKWRVADARPMDLGFDHGPSDRPWKVELWGPKPTKDMVLVEAGVPAPAVSHMLVCRLADATKPSEVEAILAEAAA